MVTTTKRPLFEAIDYPICDYIHRKTAMEEVPEPTESKDEISDELKNEIDNLNSDWKFAVIMNNNLAEEIAQLKAENARLKNESTIYQDQSFAVKYKLSEAKEELVKYRKDLTHLDDQLQESGEKIERLESTIAEYERRHGPLENNTVSRFEYEMQVEEKPIGPKPMTFEEILARPRESRFAGLTFCFTGDLRPYRKGMTRIEAADNVEYMGGRFWQKKGKKFGDFIVVGKDREIVGGKCKGIPAITAEEFLQLLDS